MHIKTETHKVHVCFREEQLLNSHTRPLALWNTHAHIYYLDFSNKHWLMVFLWSLSNSKFPQISRTLLRSVYLAETWWSGCIITYRIFLVFIKLDIFSKRLKFITENRSVDKRRTLLLASDSYMRNHKDRLKQGRRPSTDTIVIKSDGKVFDSICYQIIRWWKKMKNVEKYPYLARKLRN